MKIFLQNRSTLDYVKGLSGWTTKRKKARVFETGLEALFFCFHRQFPDMQILGEFADARMNFTFQVTGLRDDYWKLLNLRRLNCRNQFHIRGGAIYEHISAKHEHAELREGSFWLDDEAQESACV